MKERPYFRELEKRRRRIIQTKRVGPETTVSEASCAVWADCPEPEIERLHCPETLWDTRRRLLNRSRFSVRYGASNGNRFTRKILNLWAEGFSGKAFNALMATIKKHDIFAVVGLFVLVGRGLVDVVPLVRHLLQGFENNRGKCPRFGV
jgi:hypothetical protein